MADRAVMYPSNVKQPLVDTRKDNPFYCCIKAIGRDGRYEGVNCGNRGDPRYYHEWSNAMELTHGGQTQCGRPSNYYCNHRTYYDIAGYRNTCPIAGCSGTYFQPAILQLELSEAHLANHDIIDGTEIHSLSLSYNHRCLGVNVANGSTSENWGPNFCGFDIYPDLKVVKIYLTDRNGVQKGNICIHNDNPPLRGYAGVYVTIHGITYNDIVNGHINIEYQRNLSTNPGNIYIKDLSITAEYTNAYPYMEGSVGFVDLYTSNIDNCQQQGRHILDVGYQNKTQKLPLSKCPKDLRDEIIVTTPKGVTYTKNKVGDHHIEYIFEDNSNTTGVKNIVYTLHELPDKMLIYGYEAKRYAAPNIIFKSKYFQNSLYSGDSIVIKKYKDSDEVCIDNFKIYIDGIDTTPLCTLSQSNGYLNLSNQSNFVTEAGIQYFHNALTSLKCGYHEIYVQMNDDEYYTWGPSKFWLYEPTYKFQVKVASQSTGDDNNIDADLNNFHYIQNKQDDKRILSITRVDNFRNRTAPKFNLLTDTNYQNTTQNNLNTINKGLQSAVTTFTNNQTRNFDISVKYPGNYSFQIKGINDYTNGCGGHQETRHINIEPNHKQNHDVLFVRGEDSTSFEYDYLVAWEGDNIDEPINISDVDIGASFNDIRVCVESEEFFTGLSQIGVAKIKVTNKSKKTLNNIRIELNVLNNDIETGDKVSLDEFFDDGVFRYLGDNFYEYNKKNRNNLDILNLPNSVDGDNIGEENVEILIGTLEYDEEEKQGDSIEINIPFMSRSNKTVSIQPLIFEQPIDLYTYNDCESKDNKLKNFKLTVYDSILTDLTIEGETDLLIPNQINCPNECYTTELTYKIKNIDSSNTEKVLAKTQIVNDANLIPYKFEFEQNGRKVTYTDNNVLNQSLDDDIKVEWLHNTKTKTKILSNAIVQGFINFPKHKQVTLTGRTNNKGEVTFFFNIPDTISQTYTIKKLLQQVVKFTYTGNTEYQDSALYINNKGAVINTLNQKNNKNKVIFDYQQTYKRYKPGDTVEITLSLTHIQKYLDNTIIFYPNIQEVGKSDYLKVYYKICNLQKIGRDIYNQPEIKYNQGILNTTFETDDYQLIKNTLSQDIYVGLDTELTSKINIEKRIIEQNELNVINIQLDNMIRDNHEVQCTIDLGPDLYQYIGKYDIIDVTVDDGDYSIYLNKYDAAENKWKMVEPEEVNEGEEVHTILKWLIGDMKADSYTNSQVILKGIEIGLSEISVETSDFIHNGNNVDYQFGKRRCNC